MDLIYGKEKTLFAILLILAIPVWAALIVGTLGTALIYLLVGFLFYLFAQSGLIAYLHGTAVYISPTQFPDLHERIQRCAGRLDMEAPRAFLLHGGGIFNAFATRFLGKHYIALYSDVVDALEDRPDAMDFYVGHELGHIKRKHLAWGRLLFPVKWLPLIGPAYARACESTCDRHGLGLLPECRRRLFRPGRAGGRRQTLENTPAERIRGPGARARRILDVFPRTVFRLPLAEQAHVGAAAARGTTRTANADAESPGLFAGPGLSRASVPWAPAAELP